MLNFNTHGDPTDKPKLLIVHGLFGSARNWGVIAKRLSETRQVVVPDMRNHGLSDWKDTHSYEDMAADLAELTGGESVEILGHSMGGKAAMMLALLRPELVSKLIVADIAPVAYTHSQLPQVDAMKRVDLGGVERRSDAVVLLQKQGVEDALIPFFLQSLDVENRRWRLNLDVLATEMDKIMTFPQVDGAFGGDTLFLSGAASDYVQPTHRDEIKRLFPKARFAKIPGAGHWLHADKPREFGAAVAAYLG